MENEVADFLQYCRVERRLAELTCSAYERDVRACARFLQAEGVASWQEVGPAHLRRFLADEAVRRPAPSSQARTVAALKGFFRFCLENEYLERNPALVLRMPKRREALPDVLDRREVGRLLHAIDREDVWQRHFRGVKPEGNSNAGYDVKTPDGELVQVKGRRLRPDGRKPPHFSGVRKLDEEPPPFDHLIGLILNRDFSVAEAWRIPVERVRHHAVYRAHTNSWSLRTISVAMRGDPAIERIDLRHAP